LFHDTGFSIKIVDTYNYSTALFDVSPSEYLVWHALVVACSNTDGSVNHYYAASIADVARAVRIQRETVRRALLNLEKCGLARRVNERWIFLNVDQGKTPAPPPA
jgi:predicted transcriptional regulator